MNIVNYHSLQEKVITFRPECSHDNSETKNKTTNKFFSDVIQILKLVKLSHKEDNVSVLCQFWNGSVEG